jgi:hypothetical protein
MPATTDKTVPELSAARAYLRAADYFAMTGRRYSRPWSTSSSRATTWTPRSSPYGVSQAGYWVARALAFEHRFTAAIADGGVVSVGRSWSRNFQPQLLDLYRWVWQRRRAVVCLRRC